MTPDERFWEKVEKTAGCWNWTGARTARGWHGVFAADASRSGRMMVVAHRFAWELAHGPIPDGLKVCHHCDNPACVNVAHLFLGTQRVNMIDAGRKGRLGTTRGVCKRGHMIEGRNRVLDPSTGRSKCRRCMNDRRRRHYSQSKAGGKAVAEAIERVIGG